MERQKTHAARCGKADPPADMPQILFHIPASRKLIGSQPDEVRVGVRICFEVRFPEYFRELYRQRADLAIVGFCDLTEKEPNERYELIKAHLRTRGVENVFPILSVNDCGPYQSAPTAVFGQDGRVSAELEPGVEGLLTWDFTPEKPDFGAQGRKFINDGLIVQKES